MAEDEKEIPRGDKIEEVALFISNALKNIPERYKDLREKVSDFAIDVGQLSQSFSRLEAAIRDIRPKLKPSIVAQLEVDTFADKVLRVVLQDALTSSQNIFDEMRQKIEGDRNSMTPEEILSLKSATDQIRNAQETLLSLNKQGGLTPF